MDPDVPLLLTTTSPNKSKLALKTNQKRNEEEPRRIKKND
jgi:hypothetical protein